MWRIIFLFLGLTSLACAQSSVFGTSQSGASILGQSASGTNVMGLAAPANFPALPLRWADSHECDVTIHNGGVYDVTKTLGVDFPLTTAGINSAIAAWQADPDEWYHLILPHGQLLPVTGLITLLGKTSATKCFVLDSDTPLPQRGQAYGRIDPVCSHQVIDSTGYVNVSGTAVTLVSGTSFTTTGIWANITILLGQPGVASTVSSVSSGSALTLTSSAGTLSGVPYLVNPRNPGCTNDIASMGTMEGQWNPGNSGLLFQACTIGGTNCSVGPNHYLIQNTELRPQSTNTQKLFIVNLDDGDTSGNLGSSHIWFLNVYVHGDATDAGAATNHISAAFNWNSCSFCGRMYSYVDKVLSLGNEDHIDQTTWSPGPLKFAHNWLEGSSINWLTGGAVTTFLPYENVFDVELRGNRHTKPFGWMALSGFQGDLKSLMECKTCTRLVMDGSIFENSNTNGGQKGQCITLTPRNTAAGGFGDNYANSVQDITLTDFICRSAVSGIESDGRSGGASDGGGAAQPGRRWNVQQALFYNISPGNSIINNATLGQPFIIQVGGSFNNWSCTAIRSSNVSQLTCADGGTGFHETTMLPGDLTQVSACSDTTFNTTNHSSTFFNKGFTAVGGTNPAGLVVFYNNTGANVSTPVTGCTLSNHQGFPQGYTGRHLSVFGGFVGSGGAGGVFPGCVSVDNYALNLTVQDSLITPNPSQFAGLICQGDGNTEGKVSEANMADTSTVTFNNNVLVGRNANNYTDWPGGVTPSVANYFPAAVIGPGTSPTAGIGYVGMPTGASYEANATNYHDYVLAAGSIYQSGGSRQADDGTDNGANISAIDSAILSTQYTCPYICGSPGPFPD